jgi:UDP-N-acetylglucosamine--N-acetylmuramyl-(pentapeptide) pyrophosphoryl-undecaprenol N-acetylglucosamine transferase
MAGGGTGGHVIPALAVARELRRRGHNLIFVGTERGIESEARPARGFELRKIEIGGLNQVGINDNSRRSCNSRSSPYGRAPLSGRRRRLQHGRYVAGPPVLAASFPVFLSS